MLARRLCCAAAAGLAAALAAAPALSQVFKCVDADGHVTYQQSPCPAAHRGGPLDLFVENGSGRDPPEVEARWKALADQHDVAVGMPKRWVQASLGAPSDTRAGTPADNAAEIWMYNTGTQVVRIGFVANIVAWKAADSPPGTATATGVPVEQADALRSRVAAERNCEEVLGELGSPNGQEATRVTVGSGGTLRTADGTRYTYEAVPNGLPARLSFVCVDNKVVSVAREVPR